MVDLFSTMRCIINALWQLGGFTPEKLAKFNRCLFQATVPRNHENALHLLKETTQMAQDLAWVSSSNEFRSPPSSPILC